MEVIMRTQNSSQILHIPHVENGEKFVGFTELVGICEENVKNVDLEEYNIGVCGEFGLYTYTIIRSPYPLWSSVFSSCFLRISVYEENTESNKYRKKYGRNM